jgi:hypothetical protein
MNEGGRGHSLVMGSFANLCLGGYEVLLRYGRIMCVVNWDSCIVAYMMAHSFNMCPYLIKLLVLCLHS